MIDHENVLRTQTRFSQQNKVGMDAKERDHAEVLRMRPDVMNLTLDERKLYKKYWIKTNLVKISDNKINIQT